MSDHSSPTVGCAAGSVTHALLERHLRVAQIAPDLRIVHVSPRFAAAIGAEPADLIGRSIRAAAEPTRFAPLLETLHRAVRANVPWREEIAMRSSSEELRLLQVVAAPSRTGWTCWCEDVTDLMGEWLSLLLGELLDDEPPAGGTTRKRRYARAPGDDNRP